MKIGYQVQLRFVLTQHVRDLDFFKYLVEYLGFGRTAINREAVEFIVTKFSDLTDKLLPLLQKYPIVGYKYLDYLYFVKAVELMKDKAHLTEEGLNQFRELQELMNSGRKNIPTKSGDDDDDTTIV